jgi:integrase/recombinase XerD
MPVLMTVSTKEVGMGPGPEERASARSDEPEARSAARWRGRAALGTPAGLAERWPLLASCRLAARWLELQQNLGRSPRTIDAYARSLVDSLRFCDDRQEVEVIAAGRGDIAGYVHDLRERPGRHGANVVAFDSGAGLANATL